MTNRILFSVILGLVIALVLYGFGFSYKEPMYWVLALFFTIVGVFTYEDRR